MPRKKMTQHSDVLIIGAGAAGLMCAIEAGNRGRQVHVLDHSNKVGKKILMSGGGYCNFTNLQVTPQHYLSHNPHFCKSALSRYTSTDFINLMKKHQIPFHEKTLGQLFCDHKAKDIVNLLLKECTEAGVSITLETSIKAIEKTDLGFTLQTNTGTYTCESLVIATGGLSIPTLGATPFGYKVAEQFGLKLWPTRAGLVPVTLHIEDKEKYAALSGISVDAVVECNDAKFRENILFTHRGLSGPAILQISSFWSPGDSLKITLQPDINLIKELNVAQKSSPNLLLKNFLSDYFPKRVIETFLDETLCQMPLKSLYPKIIEKISDTFKQWIIKPNGTEGYRTAEVTLGGVDCNAVSSKTFEALQVKNLYFIGEVLDVSGWLGGYNFQWAWSSGWAAGQAV